MENYLNANRLNVDFQIIIGDINIDLLCDNIKTQEYLNILNEKGFVSLINDVPTRIQENSRSCLDHIFIRVNNSTFEIENIIPIVLNSTITDHTPLIMQMSFNNFTNQPNKKSTLKSINKIDYKMLREDLYSVNWNYMFSMDCVESATETFINTLQNKITNNTKCITIKIKNKKQPWIKNALVKSVNIKNKMW